MGAVAFEFQSPADIVASGMALVDATPNGRRADQVTALVLDAVDDLVAQPHLSQYEKAVMVDYVRWALPDDYAPLKSVLAAANRA